MGIMFDHSTNVEYESLSAFRTERSKFEVYKDLERGTQRVLVS